MSTRSTKSEEKKDTTTRISIENVATLSENTEKHYALNYTSELTILFENLSVREKKLLDLGVIKRQRLNDDDVVDQTSLSLLQSSSSNIDVSKDLRKRDETVLRDVTGAIFGGRLTGVVSVSGDKSSTALLEVLAAKTSTPQTGSIWANGIPSLHNVYADGVAHIDNGVTGFEELTIKQNLLFSVALRTSKNAVVRHQKGYRMSGSGDRGSYATSVAFTGDRKDAVCRTMEILELEEHKGTILRNANPFIRKRVFIAQEFLMNPFLLIIEDIVDGLATYQVQELLTMLRQLLRDPVDGIFLPTKPAIVVGLVHPKWTIMRLLDDVIMMENKTVAFIGTPSQLLAEARELHYPLMRHSISNYRHSTLQERSEHKALSHNQVRASDPSSQSDNVYDMAISSMDYSVYRRSVSNSVGKRELSSEALMNNIYRIAVDADLGTVKDALQGKGELKKINDFVDAKLMAFATGQVDSMQRQEEEAMILYRHPPAPSSAVKLFYLMYASFIELRNDFITPLIVTIVGISIAVTVATTLQMQSGQAGMQNRLGIIFFTIAATFIQTLLTVDRQRQSIESFRWKRLHGYFGPFTFLFHWVFITALIRAFFAGIFITIVYLVTKIDHSFDGDQFIFLVLIIAFTSFSLASLVACVCAIVPSTRSTVTVLFLVYLLNVLSAGLLVNMRTLPNPIQDMTYASHIHLSFEAAVVTMFQGKNFSCDSEIINVTSSTATSLNSITLITEGYDEFNIGSIAPVDYGKYNPKPCYTGSDFLHLLDFKYSKKWFNFIPLGVMTMTTLVGFYLGLQIRKKPMCTRAA